MSAMEDPHRHSDDDVNLEGYTRVLAAWWREIVFGALLAAAVGGAATLVYRVASPKYEAESYVMIVPSGTTVSIDETFRAVDYGRQHRDHLPKAKRRALLGFIRNGDVARKVVERTGKERYSEHELLQSITGEMVSNADTTSPALDENSDLIRITANADSPKDAVMLADIWTEEYVIHVNQVYTYAPQKIFTNIQAQMEKAEEDYESIQAELERHISTNDSYKYLRQIEANDEIIDHYWNTLQQMTDTLFFMRIDEEMDALSRNYKKLDKLEEMLNIAETIRGQMDSRGEFGAVSNNLSLQLLKVQIYTLEENVPTGMEIVFDGTDAQHIGTVSSQKAEIDAIIDSLRDRIMKLDGSIKRRTNSISHMPLEGEGLNEIGSRSASVDRHVMTSSPLRRLENYIDTGSLPLRRLIENLEEENKSLRTKIETMSTRQTTLADDRNQAWATVQTLRKELVELQLVGSIEPSGIRLASSAVALGNVRPSPILGAAVIGVAWIPVAAFLAFLMNSLGIRPFLERWGTRHLEDLSE